MATFTRRGVLAGVAAVALGGIAGCNTTRDGIDEGDGPRPPENVERDPENRALRHPGEELPAWLPSEESSGRVMTRELEPSGHVLIQELIASREDAGQIAYADVEGASEVKSFVEATDFEAETLLLEPYSVGACFERELCAVTWSRTEYHTYYARRYKPADYRCEADEEGTAVRFIRIPAALDPEEVTGSGSFFSTRGCPSRRQMDLPPTGSPTTAVNTSTGSGEGR